MRAKLRIFAHIRNMHTRKTRKNGIFMQKRAENGTIICIYKKKVVSLQTKSA